MGLSREEYWSGLPFPPPGDLPNPVTISYISCVAGRLFTPEPPGSPMLVEAKIIILGSQVLWSSWFRSWNELPNPSFSVKSLIQYIDHLLRKPVNFADWKIASLCFSPSGELRKQLSQFFFFFFKSCFYWLAYFEGFFNLTVFLQFPFCKSFFWACRPCCDKASHCPVVLCSYLGHANII